MNTMQAITNNKNSALSTLWLDTFIHRLSNLENIKKYIISKNLPNISKLIVDLPNRHILF